MNFSIHCPHCLQWRDFTDNAVDARGRLLRTGFEGGGEPYSCSNPNCPAPFNAYISGEKRLIQEKFNAKDPNAWFKSIPFKVIDTDRRTKRDDLFGIIINDRKVKTLDVLELDHLMDINLIEKAISGMRKESKENIPLSFFYAYWPYNDPKKDPVWIPIEEVDSQSPTGKGECERARKDMIMTLSSIKAKLEACSSPSEKEKLILEIGEIKNDCYRSDCDFIRKALKAWNGNKLTDSSPDGQGIKYFQAACTSSNHFIEIGIPLIIHDFFVGMAISGQISQEEAAKIPERLTRLADNTKLIVKAAEYRYQGYRANVEAVFAKEILSRIDDYIDDYPANAASKRNDRLGAFFAGAVKRMSEFWKFSSVSVLFAGYPVISEKDGASGPCIFKNLASTDGSVELAESRSALELDGRHFIDRTHSVSRIVNPDMEVSEDSDACSIFYKAFIDWAGISGKGDAISVIVPCAHGFYAFIFHNRFNNCNHDFCGDPLGISWHCYNAVLALCQSTVERLEDFHQRQDSRELLNGVIMSFADTLEKHDELTAGHSRRVAEITREMVRIYFEEKYAEWTGCKKPSPKYVERQKDIAWRAGMMHDIGKIVVSRDILTSSNSLSSFDRGGINMHPQVGYEILLHTKNPELKHIAEIIRQHHERADHYSANSEAYLEMKEKYENESIVAKPGYPGLVDEDDAHLLMAQFLSVADTFEACIANRGYRKDAKKNAIQIIAEEIGRQFTVRAVEVFYAFIEKTYDGMRSLHPPKTLDFHPLGSVLPKIRDVYKDDNDEIQYDRFRKDILQLNDAIKGAKAAAKTHAKKPV